jgi:hypothetical protein
LAGIGAVVSFFGLVMSGFFSPEKAGGGGGGGGAGMGGGGGAEEKVEGVDEVGESSSGGIAAVIKLEEIQKRSEDEKRKSGANGEKRGARGSVRRIVESETR